MRALHSSAALACNVFDFWRSRDKHALTEALELRSQISEITFEAQLPTGLGGIPPNLDLLLTLDSGEFLVIESKFTEPFASKSKALPFKPKYIQAGLKPWAAAGLESCQRAVGKIVAGEPCFERLDCAQLLKHALGAARHENKRVQLLYLFYDLSGPEGTRHEAEIHVFSDLINGEVGFRAISYQTLFRNMTSLTVADGPAYLAYLRDRYFPAEA